MTSAAGCQKVCNGQKQTSHDCLANMQAPLDVLPQSRLERWAVVRPLILAVNRAGALHIPADKASDLSSRYCLAIAFWTGVRVLAISVSDSGHFLYLKSCKLRREPAEYTCLDGQAAICMSGAVGMDRSIGGQAVIRAC